MSTSLSILGAVRVNAIMQGLQDVRQNPQPLLWSARIPDAPADDDEIMARFTGYVQIADLVADDQEAVTYNSGKMTFETNAVPNIKLGINLTQKQLNQLYALKQRGNVNDEAGALDFEKRNLNALDMGIRQRAEALRIAMLCDGLTYNRLGIKMNGVTWGMPADMKITPTIPWDNTTATPVLDVWAAKRTAQVRYGVTLDRLTLSLSAFLYAIATTEFQTKARTYLAPNVSFVSLNMADMTQMKSLAQSVFGVAEIEFYDARVWSQGTDGTFSNFALQPINKVILSSIANDGDSQVWDFADGIVTESIVNDIAPTSIIGQSGGPQRGPFSYYTSEHNPPTVTQWAVKRGFPRRHILQCNACLTVGSFADVIPVGEPY